MVSHKRSSILCPSLAYQVILVLILTRKKKRLMLTFFNRKLPTKFSYLSVGATWPSKKKMLVQHVHVARHINMCVGIDPAGLSPPPSRLFHRESILSSSASNYYPTAYYLLPLHPQALFLLLLPAHYLSLIPV